MSFGGSGVKVNINVEAGLMSRCPRNWHEMFWPRRMYGKFIVGGFNLGRFICRVWVTRP